MGTVLKKTVCRICNEGCILGARVTDGVLDGVEGFSDPGYDGKPPCTLGQAWKQYLYSDSRIKTPLKNTGGKGEGRFEPITWEQALSEIAERLNGYKKDFGPDSVAFYSGWTKWYRFMLQRLCYSFGSINYGSESSCCHLSAIMANKIATGYNFRIDPQNAELVLSFTMSDNRTVTYLKERQRGLKVISVDTRQTFNSQRASDLHLTIKPGTDAALAHFFAKTFIEAGRADNGFVKR